MPFMLVHGDTDVSAETRPLKNGPGYQEVIYNGIRMVHIEGVHIPAERSLSELLADPYYLDDDGVEHLSSSFGVLANHFGMPPATLERFTHEESVRDAFDYFLVQYLLPRLVNCGLPEEDEAFKDDWRFATSMVAMHMAEFTRRSHFDDLPPRHWTYFSHEAYFIYRVAQVHAENASGWLYGSHLKQDTLYQALHALFRFMLLRELDSGFYDRVDSNASEPKSDDYCKCHEDSPDESCICREESPDETCKCHGDSSDAEDGRPCDECRTLPATNGV